MLNSRFPRSLYCRLRATSSILKMLLSPSCKSNSRQHGVVRDLLVYVHRNWLEIVSAMVLNGLQGDHAVVHEREEVEAGFKGYN